jgi:hypothetical protein
MDAPATMRGFIVSSFVLMAVTAAAQRPDVGGSATTSKLATVLADLIQAVPQDSGPLTPQRAETRTLSLDALPRSVQDAVQNRRLRFGTNNDVQVYILLSAVTDETVRQLTDAGAIIEIRDAARRRVQARVPVARLQSVAQLASVDAIRLPSYARRRAGAVTTEGDAILRADAVRQQLALDGTGVRVGVISDGLKGVFATGCTTSCGGVAGGPIATADLPSAVGVRNASGVLTSSSGGIIGRSFQANGDLEGLPPSTPACGFAGAGAEGTALLEIVHDVAPGAKLSFANGDTDLAFSQAVNFLAASNDIVLDDIGFFGEPYDGTSAVSRNTAAALNNPTFPIRAYFTAVGNDADEHYYAVYEDSRIDGTTISGIANTGHLHLFQPTADTTDVLGLGSQPYNVIALPQNGEVAIFLTWDDPFGASSNDYDLYLVQQSTGRVVARSVDVQSGRQDPVETIDYVNRGGQDFFRIVVQNVRDGAQPKHLNIFSFEPECAAGGPQVLAPPRHERHNYNTATRSVSAQGDAGGSPVSVISVGAICSASAAAAGRFSAAVPDESCLDTSAATPEFFTSRGPTIDGRVKPDIAAIDGVSITGAGSFGALFFGTSAAAPHLGGLAALLLQSAPCLLNRTASTIPAADARGAVRDLILRGAVPLSGSSPNNVVGAGRADAFASVAATRPTWRGSSATLTFDGTTASGASLTGAQLGFVDPNLCGLTALNWTGACGTSPGATVTCPAGSWTISVAASNNGVSFSDPTELNIVVTDFTLDISPPTALLTAGQTSTHVVTVTPKGGPYNTEVSLACASANLPAQTTCAFDPPSVVPGAAGARSTLTISTVGVTAAGLTSAHSRGPGTRAVSAAAAGAGIAVFPSALTFGSQAVATTSPPQFVFITNSGTGALALTGITTAGDFGAVNNCGATLAVGASCTVAVTFTPTAAGTRSGTLSLADDASGSPQTVAITGTGQTASVTAGTPPGSYTVTITGAVGTLSHVGAVTLTVQ